MPFLLVLNIFSTICKLFYHCNKTLCAEKPGPKLSMTPFSPFFGFSSIIFSSTYKTVALDIFPYNRRISFLALCFFYRLGEKSNGRYLQSLNYFLPEKDE